FTLAFHDTTLLDTELIRAASLLDYNTVFTWETDGKFCYNCGSLTHLSAECKTPRTLHLEQVPLLRTPILAPRYGKEASQEPPRVVVKTPTTATTTPLANNKRPPTTSKAGAMQVDFSTAATKRLDPDAYQTQGRKKRTPSSKAPSNATAASTSKHESNSRKDRKKQRAQKKAGGSGKKLESKETGKGVNKAAPVAASDTPRSPVFSFANEPMHSSFSAESSTSNLRQTDTTSDSLVKKAKPSIQDETDLESASMEEDPSTMAALADLANMDEDPSALAALAEMGPDTTPVVDHPPEANEDMD
ncbi:hypothetical protein BX616_008259, partial [Lobosporangium transversale]